MIYLVRHGESEWNALGRLQGQMDIGLSEEGRKQAALLGAYFEKQGISFDYVFSSDLDRAFQTAKRATAWMPVETITASRLLRERFYGELQGQLLAEIIQNVPNYAENFGLTMTHGMESLEEMQERMVKVLTSISKETNGAPALVVTHGGAVNALLHKLSNGQAGTGNGKIDNTSITRLAWDGDKLTIVSINETPHLQNIKDTFEG
ncbi:histidine phosphatase family protein [Domibacillus indicus]|uniref:histidine phosphatase family protein n=1 Tax=Domibacillus indicus TaxID=1437523 RepID=UPI000617E94D|nr:histidine phosphatase family protein [Domibacillus indicus]